MNIRAFLKRVMIATVFVAGASAQFTQRSEISGLATDSTGAPVLNASVTLTDLDRNQTSKTTTNERGLYTFSNLTAGRYSVAAEMAGFKRTVSETVTLSAGTSVRVDLGLEIGAVTELVEVTGGAAPLLQVEQAAIGQVINRQMIENLPVFGRNMTSLTVLSPNVSIYSKPNTGGATTVGANHAAGGVFAVSGGGGDTGYYMNGMNINDAFVEWIAYSPSPESVAETKVDAAGFSAASGRDMTQVSIQTRNGTNQFHGAVFDYFQNSALNAWNPFVKSTLRPGTKKQLFQRNRFGGNLGGPVVLPKLFDGRDRAFFFVNYEGANENNGGSTSVARMPTAAERQGDFSSFLTRFPGDRNFVIYDPHSTTFLANGNSSRVPYANNVVSPAHIQSAARELLTMYPAPNGYVNPTNANDLNNFQYFSGLGNFNYRIDSRFDYRFSPNDSVYVSWGRSRGRDRTAGGVFPELNGNRVDTSYVLTVNYARVFTPRITNEFIFGRMRAFRDRLDSGAREYLQDPGTFRNKFFRNMGTPNNFGFYGLAITGYPTNGYTEVGTFDNPTQQFSDSVNWLAGSHALKMGMQYINQGRGTLNYQRSVTFTKQFTRSGSNASSLGGDGMADFLVGIPTSMRQQFVFENNEAPWRDFRAALWSFYLEDKWQATPKLTVNAGLRYDLPIPAWSANSFGLSVFDSSYPGGHLAIPGIADGLPRNNIPAPKKNFAPRIGLAYRAKNDFIIRTSYGVFFQAGTIEMFANQGAANNVAGDGGEVFDNARFSLHNDLPYYTFGSIFPEEAPIPLGTYPVSTGKGTGYFLSRAGQVLYRDRKSNETPYYQRWSLDLQKGLGVNTVVSLTYLGGHGTKLASYPDFNLPAYRTGWVSTAAFNNARPLGGDRFTALRKLRHDYNSNNHAGTVKLQRNLHAGLQFVAHYTFSKTVTDYGTFGMTDWLTGLFIFPNTFDYNRNLGRGEAVFSHPHRFVLALTYQTPWGRSLPAVPRALLWGWGINAIASMESGDAQSIINVQTSARDMEPNMPNISGNPNLSRGERTPYRYFNTSVFSTPAQDIKGNAGVGIVRVPGANNWNISLAKTFKPKEQLKMDIRADMYNAFNHTQWRSVNTNYSTAQGNTFGWVNAAREPRVIELGFRLSF